ncbi:RNA polymerase, sigma-24 subunit, ECF subfamily [Rhodopirellula maiorica SM1]|uniref:RNA polymerase, sigma-24 subunit, ECF subfamily n=1 Tax=Rhodopirellula maiorica SM1 TaxID=1265738 RepID=M5RR46_9BACT|nr:sigma-70 family RNA polymerase sigma factor [Rhodopirellula maiorica]EMI17852.1 RNA polymerase, sigma-24 subunit, ECF subfamily [Rhodopirellula maiorica SM1]
MSTKTPENSEHEDSDEAWRRVFLESESTLRVFMRRRLAQEADVEDCLQTVFIKSVQQGDQIPCVARRAWLFRVAANECARHWRDRSTTTRVLEKQASYESCNHTDDHLQRLVAAETVEQLQQSIKNLPDNWQTILQLRINENLTFQQIADQLQIPLGTALTQMRRALERLREDMQPHQDEASEMEQGKKQ